MTQEHALREFIKDRLQVRANTYENIPVGYRGGYREVDVYETRRVDDRFPGIVNVGLGLTTLAGAGGVIKEIAFSEVGGLSDKSLALSFGLTLVSYFAWKGLRYGLGYRKEYVGTRRVYIPGTGRYADDGMRRATIDVRQEWRESGDTHSGVFRQQPAGSVNY